MRIRLTNIVWALGGYLVGSGRAQQLWQQAQRRLQERQQQGSIGNGAPSRGVMQPPVSPYDGVTSFPADTPVESYTA